MGSTQRHEKDKDGFSLTLKHGGKINITRHASYVRWEISCFKNMDVNEWGLFTLRDKVKELGYDKIDTMKMFANMSNELIELLSDAEIWNLVKEIELHNKIEIWVVSGEIEGQTDRDLDESGSDCEWEYDAENDEALLDDMEFERNVDPNAEFGGIEADAPVIPVQCDKNLEINFLDEGNDKDSDSEEQQEYKLPKFKGKSEMASPKFCLGLTFGCKEDFKEAVYNYAIANGKGLVFFLKNDKIRCIVDLLSVAM
ncbi:uncharacterized protein LOC116019532 isoform X2 [Ipomoea triloba]|uniref:uncharacterized protein LOC116019532 isoform X2 n=1 Tax=Ipomoea triloba TaxID=35885 RepID=UPI00125D19FC|nr:uncharacterized protein LOC116019532 isoform X2 [Ipomoea triloba]